MLSYLKEIGRLLKSKNKLGEVLAGWMKVLALGIQEQVWSCDLVAMGVRYNHFKMTCHWDTYLTLHLAITI